MTRRIAIIGSNSFSGSDFIDLLLEDPGNELIGLSRSPEKSALFLPYKRHKAPRFKFHQLDLNRDMPRIFELLDSFRPEIVVNFAAQSEVGPSWVSPEQWFETNAVAIARLGNYLKDQKHLKRFVHISSPELYGASIGIREDAPPNPSTPYAASRAAGDMFLFTLVKHYGFPLVMIRSTNVYGAHQQLFKIIPRSVIYMKTAKTIELHGGGCAVKSYIHIRDVSRGTLAAMDHGREGEIYHLSPDRGMLVRDVVRLVAEALGKDFEKATCAVGERPGQDSAYVIDSSKARYEFGWRPQIPLEQGIREVVGWINGNWEAIGREPLEYQHKA